MKSRINKDILILLLGNIPRVILLVIYIRLQTFFLDYENLSKYYLIFSTYTFFSVVFIGPITLYLSRNVIDWFKRGNLISNLELVFRKLIIPISLFALIIISISIFIINYISSSIVFSQFIGLIIFILLLSKTITDFILNAFNLLGKNDLFIFLTLAFHVISPIISVFFVINFQESYLNWIVGLLIANLIIGVKGWKVLKKQSIKNGLSIDFNQIKSFSISLMTASFLGWILTDGFRFISEMKIGIINTGILILGLVSVNQIFANLEVLFNQFLMPKYFNRIASKKAQMRSIAFNKLFSLAIPIYFIISLLMVKFSDLIIDILIDKSKINEQLKTIFIISIGIELLKVLINIIKNITVSEYKSKTFIIPYIIGSLTLIIGLYSNYFNSPILISYLIFFCYCLIFVLLIFVMNQVLKIKLNISLIILNFMPVALIYFIVDIISNSYILLDIFFLLISLSIILRLILLYIADES